MHLLRIEGHGNFLEIIPEKWSFDEDDNSYDNWVHTLINIKAGGFSGSFNAYIEASEFASLQSDIEQFSAKLNSSFTFSSLEEQLMMEFIGDGLGHIKVTCRVSDDSSLVNTLSFEIVTDQSYLSEIINQIRAINQGIRQ